MTIHGACDSQFEPVREAFEHNFKQGLEVGAALAIVLDGELVVDLWGGTAIRKDGTPWEKDTLVNVYSTTKGMTARWTR